MLDVTRDRVPTMAHLLATVRLLASWKIDHLQLYTEHAFAYAGHEEVWRDASPITPAEMDRLVAFAAEHGIAVAANQNCFGHMERWLAHPRYAGLGEMAPDETWTWHGREFRGGFSLCPGDPASLALVRELLAHLVQHASAPVVNVGCDETIDLGRGRSRAECARRGRAAVYADHVAAVCAAVRELGRRPQIWADIALEDPAILDLLGDDCAYLAWGYEADSPFGDWAAQLAGREWWVCPGTACWRGFAGRTGARRGSIVAAAGAGLASGATGMMVTAWGDEGHRQQWPTTLAGIAEAADAAWTGEGGYDPRAGGRFAFGCDALGVWLDDLGAVEADLAAAAIWPDPRGRSGSLRNNTPHFRDLHTAFADDARPGGCERWGACEGDYAALGDSLPGGLDEVVADECRFALHSARVALARAIERRGGPRAEVDPAALVAEHERLWRARSRPGGLSESTARWREIAWHA